MGMQWKRGGFQMIKVTRLNSKEFMINPHLIEFIEETPDTVITLITGTKVVVTESAAQILEEIISYRKRLGEAGREPLPMALYQDGEE